MIIKLNDFNVLFSSILYFCIVGKIILVNKLFSILDINMSGLNNLSRVKIDSFGKSSNITVKVKPNLEHANMLMADSLDAEA